MIKIITITILLLASAIAYPQYDITGTFPGIANQQIKLVGFSGFDTYTIQDVKADEKGIFNLSYGNKDCGMGYLLAEDGKSVIVILAADEKLKLRGETFAFPETIEIMEGEQNLWFKQYASEHPRREQVLSAWGYLEKIYGKDSLFAWHTDPKQAIAKEKQRIKAEDSLFLAGLDPDSYISYYLPLRKQVSSVSSIAQYSTEEIPATIEAFRNISYTDPRLQKSGLLADVIESHFWLIENSGRSLDSIYIEMNVSIDYMLDNLKSDEQKLNEITEYLFKFLEQRSLFTASEYLALKLLNQKSCTLNTDFTSQLESYRAMKVGNISADITFEEITLSPNFTSGNEPKKLSNLNSNYKVVVFGASWCPQCNKDLPEIAAYYEKWKQQNVEVVFISLDENEQAFKTFAKDFPFISTCEYKKWEGKAAKDYYVFATPTIYLLNKEHKILLKPNSVSQLNDWIDWYLVQGNK